MAPQPNGGECDESDIRLAKDALRLLRTARVIR